MPTLLVLGLLVVVAWCKVMGGPSERPMRSPATAHQTRDREWRWDGWMARSTASERVERPRRVSEGG